MSVRSVTGGDSVEGEQTLSRFYIYTMRHTDKLKKAHEKSGSDTVIENKRGVKGESLFREAQANDERMPILFTAAADEGGLTYYAYLASVEIDDASQTTYSFSGLTRLDKERPKISLIKRSDNRPPSDDYVKSYAICFTPDI